MDPKSASNEEPLQSNVLTSPILQPPTYTKLNNIAYIPEENQDNFVFILEGNDIEQVGSVKDITPISLLPNINEILKQWGLFEELAEIFFKHKIDTDVFAHISQNDINELIPVIGLRTKFKKNLVKWRIDNGYNPTALTNTMSITSSISEWLKKQSTISEASISSSPSFAPNSPSSSVCTDVDVEVILKGNYLAQQVFGYYEKNQHLENEQRKDIINAICDHIIQKNIRCSTEDLSIIAEKIIDLFPNENKASYFIERTETSHPRGALYNKYQNVIRKLREKGIISRKNKCYKRKLEESVSDFETERITDTQKDSEKLWLLHNQEPWPTVESKWKLTYEQRRKELSQSSESNVTQILKEWPLLKHAYGQRLIQIDFNCAHNDAVSRLYSEWKNKSQQIITAAAKTKKINISENDGNEDLNNFKIFEALHYLLPPGNRYKLKTSSGSSMYKPSIQDSINAMFLVTATEIEVKEKLYRRSEENKSKGLTLQPLIIIVLEGNIISACFTNIDDILYKHHSVLSAVNSCFNIFHVLNLSYPRDCYNVWYFIQRFLYNIQTLYDKPVSCVASLMGSINS